MGNLLSQAPLLPEFCRVPIQAKLCSFAGFSTHCVVAYDAEGPFGDGIQLGHFLTFLFLLAIGIAHFPYLTYGKGFWGQSMTITTAFYAIVTAFFAAFRGIFNISRPLLIGAALHNLAEWSMIIQVSQAMESSQRRYLLMAFMFILFIIHSVALLPTLAAGVLLEQWSGITLDFAMPLMFNYMWLWERQDFYYLPAVAHTIHLVFTILPLVFANFFVGETSWVSTFGLELAIYISAPLTHLLYLIWAVEFDKAKEKNKADGPVLKPHHVVQSPQWYLVAGAALGLVPLIGVPHFLGDCPRGSNPNACVPNPEFYGTTKVRVFPGFGEAFEDRIAHFDLINKGRAAPGNIAYELTRNLMDPNEYRFFERWESRESVLQWISGTPQEVFHKDPAIKSLMNGTHEASGYQYILDSECRNTVQGGFNVDVEATCEQVWNVVTDYNNDCTWIQGCVGVSVDPSNKNLRNLTMENGTIIVQELLSYNDNRLVYEYLSGSLVPGFKGTVTIAESIAPGKGCLVGLLFEIPKSGDWKKRVETVYGIQQSVTIKYIEGIFQKKQAA